MNYNQSTTSPECSREDVDINSLNERFKNVIFNPFTSEENFVSLENLANPDLNFFKPQAEILNNCKYYLEDEFNQDMAPHQNSEQLSVFHLNLRSLNNKADNLQNYLSSLDQEFSVIALTETWLSDKHKLSSFKLPGYQDPVFENRTGKDGGGVAFHVKDDMSFIPRKDLQMNEAESLFIEVNLKGNKRIIIGVIYRTESTFENFTNELDQILAKIEKENCITLLTGDFNIDLLKHDDLNYVDNFINTLLSYSYYPLISKPTRVTDRTATLIDNFFTNDLQAVKSGILVTDISDHFGIFSISNLKQEARLDQKNRLRRNFSKANIESFADSLSKQQWNSLEETNNTEAAYNLFNSMFSSSFQQCFPVKKVRPPKHSIRKPWMTTGLLNSCKKKHKLYCRFKAKPTEYRERKYKTYRNKLNNLLRTTKKQYFDEKLTEAKHDIKLTWQVINEALNKSMNKKSSYPPTFKVEGKQISDDLEIANKFNIYFSTIGHNLDQQIPDDHPDFKSYLDSNSYPALVFSPTDEKEIKEVIECLRSSTKSSGHDEIPTFLVKAVSNIISAPLSKIINISFKDGIFPSELKIAKVIPIYKADDATSLNNYRPVSVLPTFSKIFERVVYSRIIDHLTKNNILFQNQFGFRLKHSTSHAVLYLIDQIANAIDNKKITIGVFLDLSKAFDTVNHHILLHKLEHYGITSTTLNWFRSYLEHRKQYVNFKSANSEATSVSYGVPQGSILGPLLFLLYINDLPNASTILHSILFADDTNLFFSHSDLTQATDIMNRELYNTTQWLNSNRLSLNVKKTHFMVFKTPRKLIDTSNISIQISDESISQTKASKFLGIIIDENLTWKTHMNDIARKVAKNIGIINKVKTIFSERMLLMLYFTMIYPYLSYGNIVWGSTYSSTLQRIFLLQKRIIRIISNSPFLAHSKPLFQKLGLLNIFNINIFQTSNFVFDYLQGNLPQCFQGMLQQNNVFHKHKTRSANDFHFPFVRTNVAKFSFRFHAPEVWNSLPRNIKLISNKKNFRQLTIQHLLSAAQ